MKVDIKTGYSIKQLLDELEGDILLMDYILQRNANQWKAKEKSLLIDSILRGVAIKPITVQLETADNNSRKWLLDGKQRLSVIREFVGTQEKDGFALSKSIEPILTKMPKMVQKIDENGEPIFEKIGKKKIPAMVQERDENGRLVYEMQWIELKGKTFNKLPKSLQDAFMNYTLMPVLELANCTPEEVQRQIIRENISAKMNASQIGTVLSGEEIAKFLKSFQTHEVFLKQQTIRDSDRNKGIVERIVGESFVLMYEPDSWSGYEAMAKKFSKFMSEERVAEYRDIMDKLALVLNYANSQDDRVYKEWIEPKNIYIIIKTFKSFLDLDVYSDIEFGKFLLKWFTEIKDNTEYIDFDVTSTKGKKSVVARYEIMEEEMVKYMEDFGTVYEATENDAEFSLDGESDELQEFAQNFTTDDTAIQSIMLITDMPYNNFETETMYEAVKWYNQYGNKDMLDDCLEYKEWVKSIDDEDPNLPFYIYAIKYIFTNNISIDIDAWLNKFKVSAFKEIDDNENNVWTSNSTVVLKQSEITHNINNFINKGEDENETV